MSDRWTPGIGDPTVIGWVTVLAYLLAATGCVCAAWREQDDGGEIPGIVPFWSSLAVGMLALGINKQLDLQSLFTQVLRDMAKANGWYEQRRPLQAAFIFVIGAVGVVTLALIPRIGHAFPRSAKVALTGVAMIFAYVVIRAASFHHVNIMTDHYILGLKVNWIIEIGGISIVCAGSIAAQQRRKVPPPCN